MESYRHRRRRRNVEKATEVVDEDAWASLLPDLLLDIFGRLETTAVIRCAGACKPWRRAIIGNASGLRPRPDRYNPNLLLGFFHHSWYAISVTAVDTGCCERLSSFITPASSGGMDLSLCYTILTSRDSFLLLRRQRRNHDDVDRLCLCNPTAGDCTFLPVAPIMEEYKYCEYILLTGYDHSPPGTSRDDMAVRILALAMPGVFQLCTEEGRMTYQVFSCGGDDGAGVWGPVQSSEVNMALRMLSNGGNTVVCRDAVHQLAGTRDVGCPITCTVGLDVYTGRASVAELPKRCQLNFSHTTRCALTTTGDCRLSLLQPLPDHHIQVWVLDGGAMEWTMQHKIWINMQIHPDVVVHPGTILGCTFPNVICPRSGLLFIMLDKRLQLRIDMESGACQPVQSIGHSQYQYRYYPYEMDWSTYISKMKIF